MTILLISTIAFLLYLIYESILLKRYRNLIPLRIAVTGTRGKSSVVRLLVSVFRESGINVLGKTTGSEALYILPNGNEIDVPRLRTVSIIEQKKLLKKAAKIKANCIVAEIMSIHPENHFIESQQILQPNIVLLTNIRKDHIDAMGKTTDEIASTFCLDVPEKATCFVPEKENNSLFSDTVKKSGARLIQVNEGISTSLQKKRAELKNKEFANNLDLVYAVGKHFAIDDKIILNGIQKTRYDKGKFKIWKYKLEKENKIYYLVNGFAANDPESTMQIISKLNEILPSASAKLVGLLNLRSDRGDRTLQWINTLKDDLAKYFDKLYVTGAHAKIVKRKLDSTKILNFKQPEKITDTIMTEAENRTIVFGFGNLAGTGKLLVDYWNEVGEDYGV